MIHVCMLAKNSVIRDGRVLREADSLALAGHKVTVVGLIDATCQEAESRRENGVRIIRYDHRALLKQLREKAAKPPAQSRTFLLARSYFRRMFPWLWLWASCLTIAMLAYTALPLVQSLNAAWLQIAIFFLINLTVISAFSLPTVKVLVKRSMLAAIRTLLRASGRRLDLPAESNKRILQYTAQDAMREALKLGAHAASADAVHCHDLLPLTAGLEVKRSLQIPLIFDAHEIYEDLAQAAPEYGDGVRKILKSAQHEVDHFITINDSIGHFYAERYGFPKPTIIKNAVPRADFTNYDGRLHKAAGIKRDQKILLYQGGFAERRGLRQLVAASGLLRPKWTLVMMGWGNIEEELRQLAVEAEAACREARTAPCVRFVPPAPQDELVRWTAGASIGAIPYEPGNLNHLFCTPNKLWEYPNAGVPVLCSPMEEMKKVIEYFGIGWVLPDGPIEAKTIADTLNSLDADTIEQAGKACRSYMETEGWHTYERRLIALYGDVNNNGDDQLTQRAG